MKKNVKFEENGLQNSDVVKWFWELMQEFDEDTKVQLLFFITGSFKVPLGGFKNQVITFVSSYGEEEEQVKHLPVAHTCSKMLELPKYDSKETLKQKLITAIWEGA